MKKIFIVGNWKMNPQDLAEAKELFDSVVKGKERVKDEDTEVVICPPFVYLSEINNLKYKIQDTKYKIRIGGQDCFYEDKGAFTGEISAVMLKNMGAEYVILGHSERRKYQQETDEFVGKKTEAALRAGLNPIVCVDNLSQLARLKSVKNLIIAYEPLECIGNGNACDPQDAEKIRLSIKNEVGENIPIIYGGSVNSQNAANYIKTAGFSGLLVGGASLNADEFVKIINSLTFS